MFKQLFEKPPNQKIVPHWSSKLRKSRVWVYSDVFGASLILFVVIWSRLVLSYLPIVGLVTMTYRSMGIYTKKPIYPTIGLQPMWLCLVYTKSRLGYSSSYWVSIKEP